MDTSKIEFYDEKKGVITDILDAAVKSFGFDQKSYLTTKLQLMRIVEKSGYEGLGLSDVAIIANKLVAKLADHAGYLLVEPKEEVSTKAASVLPSDSTETGGMNGVDIEPVVSQSSVTLSDERPKVSKAPSVKGKEKLLQLIHLLPPYISAADAKFYSAQIRSSRLGGPTSSDVARTTADFDQLIAKQVLEVYSDEFDALVKEEPQAFFERVEMVSGQSREVDISAKLRKQLIRVSSVAQFLSVKDLVERHLRDYREPAHVEKKKMGLFFWRKK